ncbi:MAG: tyrosine-type recombinase/integrase [Terriglobales bacterium]
MARNRRFQHGSIFKRGKRKKVWVARWWEDVSGRNGAVERVRRSEILGTVADIPTRREAEQILADRLRPINRGESRPNSSRTFRDYAESNWLPEVLPTLKYSSAKYYQYMLRTHLYPTVGHVQMRLITRDVVQQVLSEKLRSGLSWNTVKRLRVVLGTVMAHAEMTDLIPSNPVRKTRLPRRGPVKERAVIAPEKIRALLNALPEPSRGLAQLLVFTGLRIGELLAVRWQDVDLERGVLRVTRTVYDGHFDEPKSQRSKRSVPLGAKAIEILLARRPARVNPDCLIFATEVGTAFDRHNLLNRQLKPTCKKIGLVGVNWHWLRHANATLLDAVGTPLGTVQALLGHSSSEITREVYLHSIPSDARAAVQKVEDLLIGPKWTQVVQIPKTVSYLIQ